MEFKVINEQLPVIAINFEELKARLTETMQKYSGIVVTEETLQGCKATQKELAGIRIKIDDYRKAKKKELSKPIEVFEAQCKELIGLVDEPEKAIKEGIQVFDNKRKEEKRQKALGLIEFAIHEFGLSEKYSGQLTVIDKYMNLTATAKEVKEDIKQRAAALLEQQQREIEMIELINSTIENANKDIAAKLSIVDFQRLIDQQFPTTTIINEINSRADRIRKSEAEAEERRIKMELEAKKAEEERPKASEMSVLAPVEEPKEDTPQWVGLGGVPVESERNKWDEQWSETQYFVVVKVKGTEKYTRMLGDFLRDNGFNSEVIEKGIL